MNWFLCPLGGIYLLCTAALSESPVVITPGERLDDFEWCPNIFLIGVKSFLGELIVVVSEPESVCGGVKLDPFCGIWGEFKGVVLDGPGREYEGSGAASDAEESLRR